MSETYKIVVDLVPMSAGGGNGGIKHFVFDFVRWIHRKPDTAISFIFVISSQLRPEIEAIKSPADVVVINDRLNISPVVDALAIKLIGSRVGDLVTKRSITRHKPDIIYCPLGLISVDIPGVPVMATVADLLHVDYPDTLTNNDVAYRNKYLSYTMQRASVIHAISDYTAGRIAHVYPSSTNKIVRSYLRPPFRPMCAAQTSYNASHETSGDGSRPYFFYPANFWHHKNHSRLIEAYAHYLNKTGESSWSLFLTGDLLGAGDKVTRLLDRYNIQSSVRHEGFVSDDRISHLWANAGALIFPSLHEGFGLPLVEAMRYGVPIICGKNTSIGEIAGSAAYFVDVTDVSSIASGLLEVSSNPELRSQLVSAGTERLRSYFDDEKEACRLLNTMLGACRRETSTMQTYS